MLHPPVCGISAVGCSGETEDYEGEQAFFVDTEACAHGNNNCVLIELSKMN